MKLYLIRHGRTMANEKWLYCGSTDIPLSDNGVKRINKSVSNYPEAQDYYTSGMKRAEQTFSLLYGDIAHTTVPELSEMDFGDFEMHSYEELKNDPKYLAWITGDNFKNVCPNGESGAQMTERVLKAFRGIAEKGRDAVIVTHGGVIAAIMDYLFPDEGKNRYDWQPGSAEGYAVDLKERKYHKIPQ